MSGIFTDNASEQIHSPLHNPLWSAFKSGIDIIGAISALILTSPLFLFIAYKIRQDGGSAFYSHERIGKNGKPFKCIKFRSMIMNSQEVLDELLANDEEARTEWERDFKLKNDPRITPVGRFIRKTSLDELPQLFNVLKGEMSLVGPRPVIDEERKYYGDHWDEFLSVKPGMTGLWQVSGRNDTTYDERVRLDVEYIRGWSLWMDIKIAYKTIFIIINPKGAY